MGLSTEQTVAVMESTAKVIEKTQPKTNYGWALVMVIIPVILTWYLSRWKND